MIQQAFHRTPLARGLHIGRTHPAYQQSVEDRKVLIQQGRTDTLGTVFSETFETPLGQVRGPESPVANYGPEEARNLQKVAFTMDQQREQPQGNPFLATVSAELVGGAAGLAIVRELSMITGHSLLEIDFAQKPSAKAIAEGLEKADWVVIQDLDRAGASHEAEITQWLQADPSQRRVMSLHDQQVVLHDQAKLKCGDFSFGGPKHLDAKESALSLVKALNSALGVVPKYSDGTYGDGRERVGMAPKPTTARMVEGFDGITLIRELARVNQRPVLEVNPKSTSVKGLQQELDATPDAWVVIENADGLTPNQAKALKDWQKSDDSRVVMTHRDEEVVVNPFREEIVADRRFANFMNTMADAAAKYGI